ncbi:hypothetical protein AGMMS50267_14890 [Spirochaetia bacterium]|nr:hypothetical protein AGMMS50267_14890 [Spirochaetia bacterium]
MQKKLGFSLIVLTLCAGFGYAFDLNGFEINIDLDVNAFELRQEEKSDVEQRRGAGNFKPQTIAWPFGGYNLNGDTNLYLTYTGERFGGTFGLSVEDDYWVKSPALKAWAKPFGDWFKITVGKDIGSGYVDNLDADPGMRIYYGVTQAKWADTKDPDNITQDEGVLLESFFAPVTIAMAGRYYDPTVFPIALNSNVPNRTKDEWEYVDQVKFSYGARVGSEIGSFGKVNASYIIEYSNWASSNQQDYYGVDSNNDVVAKRADAEVMDHLFGVYASLTPLTDFGVSIGYNGIITKYLADSTMPSCCIRLYKRRSLCQRSLFQNRHEGS